MFTRAKPSLRYFAVLEIEHRSYRGKIYRVQDRRGVRVRQLLFVPSRFLSWPRYLTSLQNVGAAPVRLRNAKVAFLLREGIVKQEAVLALRISKAKPLQFNSLSGFHGSVKSISKRVWLCTLIACVLALSISITTKGTPPILIANADDRAKKIQWRAKACNEIIQVGEKFMYTSKNPQISLGGVRQPAKGVQMLGGYLQASVKSRCGAKDLKFVAWLHRKTYEIVSVN